MFDTLARQPDDPLLALIGLYRADARPGKVDLGVGVYKDEQGATPIFRAVKEAERRLLEGQITKSYVGPEGDPVFLERLWELTTGSAGRNLATAGVQTPGGSGAVRLAGDLMARMGVKRIWLGVPTWPNHAAIFKAAGLEVVSYPFFDVPSQTVLFDRMMEALQAASAGEAVLAVSAMRATGARPACKTMPVCLFSPSSSASTGCDAGVRGSASRMSSRCATAIGKRRAFTGATRKPSTAINSPSSWPRST